MYVRGLAMSLRVALQCLPTLNKSVDQVVAGARDQRDGKSVAIKRISDVFLKDPVPAKR